MTGNLFLDGALVLLTLAGIWGLGKLNTFREKALAETAAAEEDPKKVTKAQEIGVQL